MNCTIANNSGGQASGLEVLGAGGQATARYVNTIFANAGSGSPNVATGGSASITSQGHNIADDGSGNLTGSGDKPNTNPRLAPLGNYGGPTQTMALLPGSPAIDAGTSTGAPATDQRGLSPVGTVDIGAFESQGFTLSAGGSTSQSAAITAAFANSLVVTVTANNSVEPVAGGLLTFTAPATGASAAFTSANPAVVAADGTARVSAQANDTVGGPYSVTVAASGAAAAAGFAGFSLSNTKASTSVQVASDASSATYGQSVTFSATITAPQYTGGHAVGGTADLVIDGSTLQSGVAVNNGRVTFSAVSSLTATGSPHSIKVVYDGDSNFLGNNALLSGGQTVNKATLTIMANANSKPYGQTANDSGTLTGVVNGDGITAAFSSPGDAATTPIGTYPITATLADPNNKLGNYIVHETDATLTVGSAVTQHSAATDPNGDQEMFGIGFDHALWVNSQTSPNGLFGGWYSLGGYVKQITVGTNNNGTLEVFGIGADNGAWFRQQQAGSLSWSNWQSLSGYVKQLDVGRDPNGDLELFGIGAANGVWLNTQTTPAGSFGGWTNLGGYVKQITVGANHNGTLEVFGIGADNGAWFRQQQAGSLSWSDWQSLGGYVKQLEVGRDANGDLELFAIGAANGLWVSSQTTPAGSFGGWYNLGGNVKQITVGANNNGSLEVFGIGGNNAAWFCQQQAGSWSTWQSQGGYVKHLEVGRESNGDLELFGIGAANGVWVNSQTSPAGSFGSWSSLGGYVI
jgi:hypothetical protein